MHADCTHPAFAGNDEAVVEVLDLIDCAFAGNGFAAFTQLGEDGCVAQNRILKSDFGQRAVLLADGDNWGRDVLEAAVLHPELVWIAGIDVDGSGHIAEGVADRMSGQLRARGWRIPAGHRRSSRCSVNCHAGEVFSVRMRVAAAVEVQVFGLVADLVKRGEAGADVEVHVGEEGVLGDMEADGDGGGIAVANFEVDVGHRRVEGVRIGVGDVEVRRNGAGRREGDGSGRHAGRRADRGR